MLIYVTKLVNTVKSKLLQAFCATIEVTRSNLLKTMPGARPTKHISIEFEIRWKFKTL